MKKNSILINLTLVGLSVLLGQQLFSQWKSYQATHNLVLLNPKPDSSNQPNKITAAKSPEVFNYAAIIDNNLFVQDRNNLIAPDPTPTQTLAPKPILTGILGFGGEEFALMISADPKDNHNYKRVKVGESISGYTLTKILDQKVLMSAEGQQVEVRISEPTQLVARDYSPPAPATSSNANTPRVSTISSEPSPTEPTSRSAAPNAPSSREEVPAGTIVGGKKKVVHHSPFGDIVFWVDANAK